MWLTGRADGPALPVAGAPAEQVVTALDALGVAIPDAELLGERAALAGLSRRGAVSAGGACRLLPAADGWVALSLSRDSDVELLPALLEAPAAEPWPDVAAWLARTPTAVAVARAIELGLAAAVVPAHAQAPERPPVLLNPGGPMRRRSRLRVLDLGSLWAGPLCAHLLGLAGADVVKVESIARPDGARRGEPRFYDLLNAGQRSVALDFAAPAGRCELHRLIEAADVVIEASRPRALRQLGVDADAQAAAGTVWVSITAYGRADGMRVGFGDDVAAGAGLLGWDADGPVFAGDALADPLTGVQAALAATEALAQGHGALLDVSMHHTARTAALAPPGPPAASTDLRPPVIRHPAGRAAPLGAHTADPGW